MAEHNKLGNEGEKYAAKFLADKGYQILATNWRYGKKEIDIIARKAGIIAIVEVKTRTTDYFGRPEESVNLAKQKYLVEAANHFIQQIDFEADVRFDIISILKNGRNLKIEHIEEAYIPLSD
jgi:putative endonuclease